MTGRLTELVFVIDRSGSMASVCLPATLVALGIRRNAQQGDNAENGELSHDG